LTGTADAAKIGGVRKRFWIEAGLAVASFLLLLLTLVTREWIEILTGWDPDGGNGSVEWLLVMALVASTATFGLLARAERMRSALAG
jgi:hypothetical protein